MLTKGSRPATLENPDTWAVKIPPALLTILRADQKATRPRVRRASRGAPKLTTSPGDESASAKKLRKDHLARGGATRPAMASFHAAVLSSLSAPRATILIASSGNGRCSVLASSHGARTQTSHSSSVIRMIGMAFGWIGSTTAFGDVVRKP